MKMRRLDIAIAVWGAAYVDAMLTWAVPTFLAPGNLPACSAIMPIRVTIVTRPEDANVILEHPVADALRDIGELAVVPLLTIETFVGANRYDVMALSHRHCLAASLRDNAIITLLSPDCLVADGSLSHGLGKITEGKGAVLVAGPRATFEDVTKRLPRYRDAGAVPSLSIPARDLVSLAARFPHEISRLLFWTDQPFSRFPSAIYWRAGEDSFLARYFHLHPLFVNLAVASPDAANSGTIDGSLLSLAKIQPEDVYVAEQSDEVCIIELSRINHDPMGSLPLHVKNKTKFVAKWAIQATDATHRGQFSRYVFRFQGKEKADWDLAISKSRRDTRTLEFLLNYVEIYKLPAALRRWFRKLPFGKKWAALRNLSLKVIK